MKIVISEQADADLLQIFQYLAERNPNAAGAIARDIDGKFRNLCDFPFIGRERSSLAHGLRSIVAGIHVIFYIVERDRIVVVRVLDGRRDIDAEFQR
jgi:toxin ParE1/3/4